MSGEISTIQSLKAVDAWIDVINANINGGVRTAFKASRLSFSGSNTNLDRPGNSTSLPLQFPEPSLTTANTVIDWSQGAIAASSEDTHVALNGDGFFVLSDSPSRDGHVYFTRDGEFHWDDGGFLVNKDGLYVLGAGNASAQTAANPIASSDWVAAAPAWGGGATAMWYPGGTAGSHPIGTYADPLLFRKVVNVPGPNPVTITISTGEDACAKFFLDGVDITINGGPYPGYDYVQGARLYTFTLSPGSHVMTIQAFDDNMGGSMVRVNTTVGPALFDSPSGWQTYPALSTAPPNWDQPYDIVTQSAAGTLDPATVGIGMVTFKQELQYTHYGSTVLELRQGSPTTPMSGSGVNGAGTVVGKSLEASNSSMTQSVPELSLAQKLFSALTKVLQTKQTNVDGILNLVR